ncbi:MAG: sigma 54-interacting transcriptional regulator [Nitrospiraceae bacterium]
MGQATRVFFSTLWLQAVTTGLVATLLAALLWAWAPALYSALDSGPYDTWLTLRHSPAASPDILLILRDQSADQQFGTGLWDRSLVARSITALHDAGASRIGIDLPIDRPSPPNLGGAVSDALLIEAIKSVGSVAYPLYPQSWIGSDPTLESSGKGTLPPEPASILPELDPDRVVRRLPLSSHVGALDLPAFGVLLAMKSTAEHPNTERLLGPSSTNLLLSVVQDGSATAFRSISFADFMKLLAGKHGDELDHMISGKIAVLLLQPRQAPAYLLPSGQEVSDGLLHVHLLNTLLTRHWIHTIPAGGRLAVAIALAAGIAYVTLRRANAAGWLFGVASLGIYTLIVLVSLWGMQVVLPVVLPFTASSLVLLTTGLLGHVMASRRMALVEQDMLHIQQDLSAAREALVCRENAVESLEEDLESARIQASQSATKEAELLKTSADLHHRMLEAQQQETAARSRIDELERQLGGLRTAAGSGGPLGDVEQDQLRRECEQLGIVTRHPRMLGAFRDIKKGSRSAVTVLILGEPGTGKELFARAVHRLSPRGAKAFVAVNMAAISPELFESELFGHVRGSFTGALSDRKGFFELAHQGTIFLDEIGDLRLDHQSKLLRVLQDRTFYRVGATTPTTVDVRIVAATNKDLQRGVSEGWFREDLYFRLKGLVLTLPTPARPSGGHRPAGGALSERADAGSDRPPMQLSQEALETLAIERGKGNVRELRQCLEQAAALSDRPILTALDLRLDGTATAGAVARPMPPLLPDASGDAAVLTILGQHGFDVQATAKALGWDRSTVTQRLKGLCFQALVHSRGDKAQAAATLAESSSHTRTVELKLLDYYNHLLETIQPFTGAEEALADCKRRFKACPTATSKSVEALVREHFRQSAAAPKP